MNSNSSQRLNSSSPNATGISFSRKNTDKFYLKRDSEKIKIDDYLSMGRPLWTSETGKLSPGPDVYEKKSNF